MAERSPGPFDHRPGGRLEPDAELLGQEVGQAGLAQSRRTVEKDMVEMLAPLLGGLDIDLQVVLDLVLADEFVEAPGPEAVLEEEIFLGPDGVEDGGSGREAASQTSGQRFQGFAEHGFEAFAFLRLDDFLDHGLDFLPAEAHVEEGRDEVLGFLRAVGLEEPFFFVDFIGQLHGDPKGGFLADARDHRDPGDVARADGLGQRLGVHPGKNGDGQLRADPGDRDELEEDVLFLQGQEAEKRQGVVGEMGVDEELDPLALLADLQKCRKRDGRRVPHAAAVDDEDGRRFLENDAIQVRDHTPGILV